MRIALLVPGKIETISGGYGYDRAIAAGLRAHGHTVEIVELAGRHPLPDAGAQAAAQAALQALAPDAVPVIDGLGLLAFSAPAPTLAPLLAPTLATRGAVGLVHHPVSLEPGLPEADVAALKHAEAALFPVLRRIIVTSHQTGERLAAEFGVNPGRIRAVIPGTAPAPRSPGSGGPGCAILAVGSLIPRKGHDMLIHALARLFDLDWRLTIAGGPIDGVHAHSLRALAEELGVTQRVTFAGEVSAPALDALWQGADLFALATRHEGYGMAIAEALRRGLPAVVMRGGAASDLITPEAGAVCEVGDVITYSKALRRFIFDLPLRHDAAEAAWKIGQTLPDWPEQAREFAAALA